MQDLISLTSMMEPENSKAWSLQEQQLQQTAGHEHVKMEPDSMFNNNLEEMDKFLNEIWSDADLEPPNLGYEHQTNVQTDDVQFRIENMNYENFVVKEEAAAEESKLCEKGIEFFVMKEEISTEGRSNFSARVHKQRVERSAGSCSRLVDKAEIKRIRMLKNRASAARSRARNLVRLVSLELEIRQYKEENAMLRQKKFFQHSYSEYANEQEQLKAERKVHRCNSCSW